MIEVRVQDRIFVAVALPLALAALYWFGWRSDAAARAVALESQLSALVAPEDYDFELKRAERQLEESNRELEAERQVLPPPSKVKGLATDDVASRESKLLAVLRASGLCIASVKANSESHGSGSAAIASAGEVLRATGVRPQPVRLDFEVIGRYPQIGEALSTIDAQELAVVVERISMDERGHWKLGVWL